MPLACRYSSASQIRRDSRGLGLGQRLVAGEDLHERFAVEKLHHEIRPALRRLDLDDLQDRRVIEPRADFFLALEPLESRDIAFEGHERDLDRDALVGLAVAGLEDRGHVAARNEVGELKTVVEQLPRREIAEPGDGLGLRSGAE